MASRDTSLARLTLPIASDGVSPPLLGALARRFYEALRRHVIDALHAHGYTDITQTELGIFHDSGPDRARPIELAQRCHMTKQAMNYVLTHMERRGYLKRRPGGGADNRLVYLTSRGWKVYNLIRGTIDSVDGEWSAQVGRRRFDAMREVLSEIIVAEEADASDERRLLPRRRGRRPRTTRRAK